MAAWELRDLHCAGPAMPDPFVRHYLEGHLTKLKLLPKGRDKVLQTEWLPYRHKLRALGDVGGERRVYSHVLEPLLPLLGYKQADRQEPVQTREGLEYAGWLMTTADQSAKLRVWAVEAGTDLDAPPARRAYRFSPARVAQRVLLATGERIGLLTDGVELRILLCDPARPDSHLAIRLDRAGGWRAATSVPDSFRLLLALASPEGVAKIADLTEAARLAQTTVTRKLRQQARSAVEGFVQELLDQPANWTVLASLDRESLPKTLWHEGLILVYRLLFILKLESSADPARAFSFASTSLWRNSFSPSTALARHARASLDSGTETGSLLEGGLRTLFRLFSEGLESSELKVTPLGGMLFGTDATPLLDQLKWGERAVASLLDRLLWTPVEGRQERQRVHYGALDIEDLGRVYEALLELEPGISDQPMCRLRRAKLEVVVPEAQGKPYQTSKSSSDAEADDEDEADDDSGSKKKTKVQWIEAIPANRFYLRVGLGRKASGSYYTPHPFVRFLVQETLGPQVSERSPGDDPNPGSLLELKVLDPAMGSGHFLVEACRYLGEKLYEACRLCDEMAAEAERQALQTSDEAERQRLHERALTLTARLEALPDPNRDLLAYLPSRVPEGEDSGLSQFKAEAICRRLVAIHCIYGVDKNLLAVELAKLSLWLESYAEGYPLTFMNHRLVHGDSLTGPFIEHLYELPVSKVKLGETLFHGLETQITRRLGDALQHLQRLEGTIDKSVTDIHIKTSAKKGLDEALVPLKLLAAAWSGAVMLGSYGVDDAYRLLVETVGNGGDTDAVRSSLPLLEEMIAVGKPGVAYDLIFPEVFHPDGAVARSGGFHAVVGNPPWDRMLPAEKEFYAGYDLRVLQLAKKRDRAQVIRKLEENEEIRRHSQEYLGVFRGLSNVVERIYQYQVAEVDGESTIGKPDAYRYFMEKSASLLKVTGRVGLLVPSGFHSNEGATGIRQLYLTRMCLETCFSFDNKKAIFDIHRSTKFASIVAANNGIATDVFRCGFYWKDSECLFNPIDVLNYSLEFVKSTAGEYLSFVELTSEADFGIASMMYGNGLTLGVHLGRANVTLGRELNTSDDDWRMADFLETTGWIGQDPRDPNVAASLKTGGFMVVHEGKTFHQFDDRWGEPATSIVSYSSIDNRPDWSRVSRYFRLVTRKIARSTDDRTGIATVLPPGVLVTDSAYPERKPERRPDWVPMVLAGCINSFAFDWLLRQKTAANVNLFILHGTPLPRILSPQLKRIVAHGALRVTCNHDGYAPLWIEQVGDAWREPTPKHTWPILAEPDARWAVRAAMDAVIADAYGLSREQYAHVLSSFSHSSYSKAPELCLAAFDELQTIGVEAFCRKHDPYWDVPLNEALPQPVIDLPIGSDTKAETAPSQAEGSSGQMSFLSSVPERPMQRRTPAKKSTTIDQALLDQVRSLLRQKRSVASTDAQALLGLDAMGVRPYLEALIQEGIARAEGQARAKRYLLVTDEQGD